MLWMLLPTESFSRTSCKTPYSENPFWVQPEFNNCFQITCILNTVCKNLSNQSFWSALLNIYRYSFGCSVLCMWDLVPQPGIKPRPPALGAQSPSHWTTMVSPIWSALILDLWGNHYILPYSTIQKRLFASQAGTTLYDIWFQLFLFICTE